MLGSESGWSANAGPLALTVPVALQPGWSVPAADPESTGGSESAGSGSGLRPGEATVGAIVAVADGATMAVVHGSSPRRLAYRTGVDEHWGDWQELTISDDEGPDALPGDEGSAGRALSAGPLWLGTDVTDIEFVVVGGDTSSFEVSFLGSGPESGRQSNTGAAPAPAGASLGGGSLPAPPIIPRAQWASAEWAYQKDGCDEGPSVSDHIQAAVIHHTATTNSYSEADVDDLLRGIYYSHVVVNGWCDIGYNFVVDRFGRIWEARTGSIDRAVIGGHARGFNTSTVGIALLGQHQAGARPPAATPSAAAQTSVEAVARWRLGREGVDPAGSTWLRNRSSAQPSRLAALAWHYVPTILAHRDLGVTSCPGSHTMALVRDLPARLAASRDVSLPYSFVDWRAHDHGPSFVVAESGGGIRPAGSANPWPQSPAALPGGSPVIAVGGNLDGGYLLTASGDVVGFGTAPAVADKPAGTAVPVDIAVRSDGRSGWVLDDAGLLHGFGGAADLSTGGPIASPVAVAVDDAGAGQILASAGTLHAVGGTPAQSPAGGFATGVAAVDIAVRPDGRSGWVLDGSGRLHGFGDAPSDLVRPPVAVRAVAAADSGPGGWVLDAQGQLWPFGGARLVFPVSTNASAANAVDLADVGSVYSPAFVAGADARFLGSVHRLFLGRDPTPAEVDLAAAALEQGGSRRELTSTLARSEFWSGGTVDEMYRVALGREPDPEGRNYWLSEIGKGLRLQDLGIYFYGSSEYARSAGSSHGYVTGLYNVLLHRAPDAEGLAYWVGVLDRREAAPPDVANGFYASIESRRDRAGRLYRQIFDTPPSGEDRELWAERLLVVGDGGVAAELAASSHYYRLAVDGPEP